MAGYLPPGITADEMERAIAMSQGASLPPMQPATMQPDPVVHDAPPAPMPMPEPAMSLPADMPQQPAPVPPMPAAQEEEAVADVEAAPLITLPTGKPKQNIAQLEGEIVDLQNTRAEGLADLGDKAGLSEDDYTKMADAHRQGAAQSKATSDAAKVDLEQSRQREAMQRDRAEKIWQEMEANKHPPPDSTVQKVLGIIGSVIAMGSNKGGTAQGVSMLVSMLGGDKERWAQERAANSDLYKKTLEGAENERATQLDHLTGAQKVAALEALSINDVLESAKNMGLGAHATAVANDMQNAFITEAKQGILKAEEHKQTELEQRAAAAAKLKMAQREAAQRDALSRMGEEELQAMLAQGNLGELGQQILAGKIKTRQAGAKGEADVLAAQTEALGGGKGGAGAVTEGSKTTSGRVVENPDVYKQLSATERSKIAEEDAAAQALSSSINELLDLRKQHGIAVGVPGTDAYRAANAINSTIQLALKEQKKLGTLDKGSTEFLEEMTGNPNAWGSAPEVKLRTLQEGAIRDVEARAKNAGLSAGAVQGAPKPVQIQFKKKAGPNGAAGDAARQFLETRGGAGSGGA